MIEPAFEFCPQVSRPTTLSAAVVDYKCEFEQIERQMTKDIRYLAVMYGYLLQKGETLTFNDFADRVAKSYDQSVPRNFYLTNQLRVHQKSILASKPCVIFHPEHGVFLGEFLGLGIWSELDSAGQNAATTFPNQEAAEAFLKTWPTQLEGIQTVPVTPGPDGYADIDACVAAGLPEWTVEDERDQNQNRQRQSA